MKRVEEDEKGQKHCTGQYFDYWGCIDQCVSLSLVSILMVKLTCIGLSLEILTTCGP